MRGAGNTVDVLSSWLMQPPGAGELIAGDLPRAPLYILVSRSKMFSKALEFVIRCATRIKIRN